MTSNGKKKAPFRFDHATAQYKADQDGMTVVIDAESGFEIDMAGPMSDEARTARHGNALRLTGIAKNGSVIDLSEIDQYRAAELLDMSALEMYARRARRWRGLVGDDAGTPVPCTYENALTLYKARPDIVAKLRGADRERNVTFRRDQGDAQGVRGVARGDVPDGGAEGSPGATVGAPPEDRRERKGKGHRADAPTTDAAAGP